jgi:putative transposase
MSVRRQCETLGMPRSTCYYESLSDPADDLRVMRMIDEQYLVTPFYGSRRMTVWLRAQGEEINRKRVQRLMRTMGLEAIYPRPHTSDPAAEHRIFPYLLRTLSITRPNQVWCSDITYVPMPRGFMYLTAVMDWFSRHVLSWRLSNTLEGSFCCEAVDAALTHGTPEIFNTDQGSQFTSESFTSLLAAHGVQISMDGRGRALDNVFIERLWRSVKYECIYLHGFTTVAELQAGLATYFTFYSHERFHQGLSNRTPFAVHTAVG